MSEKKTLKFSDQVIGQIRELLQLCLLTGTNIVDNLRAVELEISDDHSDRLQLSKNYCDGWNDMVVKMTEDATKKLEEMQKTVAEPESPPLAQEKLNFSSEAPPGITPIGEFAGLKLGVKTPPKTSN